MHFLLFLPYYFRWHYTKALRDLFLNLKNGLLFVLHFFSLALLIRTLFTPWKRLGEGYKRGFDLGAFFSTFVVNLLLRFVGFVIRFVTIILGLLTLILSFSFALILTVIWIIFPVFLAFILALAIKNFF